MATTIDEVKAKVTRKEDLTEADWKVLLSAKPGVVSGNDLAATLKAATDYAYSTPQGQQAVKEMLSDEKTSRFVRKYKPFFQSVLTGADIGLSLSQIHNSNAAVKKLIQPGIPSAPGLPPELNGQINQAQVGGFQAARALAPAQLENAQAFQSQVNNAKNTSGGNIGSYNSAYNAAVLQRQRAAASFPAIQDAIRARQQERADHLIGLKGQLGQEQYRSQLAATGLSLDQYNRNANAAGALGQAGRQNLYNTLGQLPDTISNLVGRGLPVNSEYSNPSLDGVINTVSHTGVEPEKGQDWSIDPNAYAAQVTKSLINHQVRQRRPI